MILNISRYYCNKDSIHNSHTTFKYKTVFLVLWLLFFKIQTYKQFSSYHFYINSLIIRFYINIFNSHVIFFRLHIGTSLNLPRNFYRFTSFRFHSVFFGFQTLTVPYLFNKKYQFKLRLFYVILNCDSFSLDFYILYNAFCYFYLINKRLLISSHSHSSTICRCI